MTCSPTVWRAELATADVPLAELHGKSTTPMPVPLPNPRSSPGLRDLTLNYVDLDPSVMGALFSGPLPLLSRLDLAGNDESGPAGGGGVPHRLLCRATHRLEPGR